SGFLKSAALLASGLKWFSFTTIGSEVSFCTIGSSSLSYTHTHTHTHTHTKQMSPSHTQLLYIHGHTHSIRAVKIAQKLHSNIPFKKTHIFEHIRISVCALGTSITGQINTSRDITTCLR